VKKNKYFLVDAERSLAMQRLMYWKAGGRGYTSDIEEAGVYSQEQAIKQVETDIDELTLAFPFDALNRIFIDQSKTKGEF
jgi:hypothetical protein